MSLTLDQMAELVRAVARERRVDCEVVGVTPAEGDGRYAEVIVDLPRGNRRLALGLERDSATGDLRERIERKLVAAAHPRGIVS